MRKRVKTRESLLLTGVQYDKGALVRKYPDSILIKLKKGDREKLYRRMEEAGMVNMSAFIRKMAMDGYVIKLDLSEMNEFVRLLRINSNNLNQYAKKANETGNIYLADIKELQKQQDDLWNAMKDFLKTLSSLT